MKTGPTVRRPRPAHRAGDCPDRRTTRCPVAARVPEVRVAASGRRRTDGRTIPDAATGAAGEQLGPQTHAFMSVLNKRLGLSHGKIGWMFERVFGLKIDRSTSARSGVRTARRLAAVYGQIRGDIRAAERGCCNKAWPFAIASRNAKSLRTGCACRRADSPPNWSESLMGVSPTTATGDWQTSSKTICVKRLRTCVIQAWPPGA